MRAIPGIILIAVAVAACVGSPAPGGSPSNAPTGSPRPTGPDTSPTPTRTMPPARGGSWERIGILPGSRIYGDSWVADFAGGYIALAVGEGGTATAWTSSDGVEWSPNDLPSPEPMRNPHFPDLAKSVHGAYPTALATDGTTVVIVGGYPHAPCRWMGPDGFASGSGNECIESPISWASDDGITWRSSLPWVGPERRAPVSTDPQGGFDEGSTFNAVWAVPGGWEAALGYWDGSVAVHREIWSSSDGLSWELRATVFDVGGLDDYAVLVGSDGRRVLATTTGSCVPGPDCPASVHLWTSYDGVGWQDLTPPDDISVVSGGIGPSRDGEPWLLTGARCSLSSDQQLECERAVWASDDLLAWRTVLEPVDGIDGFVLGKGGDRYVASGRLSDGSALGWTSDDGMTWVPIPEGPAILPDDPVITAMAFGRAGLLGFGIKSDEGSTAVYAFR